MMPGEITKGWMKLPNDLAESKDSGLDTSGSGSVTGYCCCSKLEVKCEKLKEDLAFKEAMIVALQESNLNLRMRAAEAENKASDLRIFCESIKCCCSNSLIHLPTRDRAPPEWVSDEWGRERLTIHECMKEKERNISDKSKEFPVETIGCKTAREGEFLHQKNTKSKNRTSGDWNSKGNTPSGTQPSKYFRIIGGHSVSVSSVPTKEGFNSNNLLETSSSKLDFAPWKPNRWSASSEKALDKEVMDIQRSSRQGWGKLYECLDEAEAYARSLGQGLGRLEKKRENISSGSVFKLIPSSSKIYSPPSPSTIQSQNVSNTWSKPSRTLQSLHVSQHKGGASKKREVPTYPLRGNTKIGIL